LGNIGLHSLQLRNTWIWVDLGHLPSATKTLICNFSPKHYVIAAATPCKKTKEVATNLSILSIHSLFLIWQEWKTPQLPIPFIYLMRLAVSAVSIVQEILK
jgi:hypothetical protein